MKTILPFIQKRVVVLHEDSRLNQAARAMTEHGIGCVVVIDRSGHVTGIVTDRDLVKGVLAEDKEPESIEVSEIMTRDPVTVEENATIQRVIALMEENGVRRIPVVHRLSRTTVKCIGIVTLDDLAMSRSIDPQHLMRVLRSQLKRKIVSKAGKRKNGRTERKELSSFYERVSEKVSPQLELNREDLSYPQRFSQRLRRSRLMPAVCS
jgi:CBS domain-containing protein